MDSNWTDDVRDICPCSQGEDLHYFWSQMRKEYDDADLGLLSENIK